MWILRKIIGSKSLRTGSSIPLPPLLPMDEHTSTGPEWTPAAMSGQSVKTSAVSGGALGAVLGGLVTYGILLIGDRASDVPVVLACVAAGLAVGAGCGAFAGLLLRSGYRLTVDMPFWAGVFIMGTCWTLFIPPFWDKVDPRTKELNYV